MSHFFTLGYPVQLNILKRAVISATVPIMLKYEHLLGLYDALLTPPVSLLPGPWTPPGVGPDIAVWLFVWLFVCPPALFRSPKGGANHTFHASDVDKGAGQIAMGD